MVKSPPLPCFPPVAHGAFPCSQDGEEKNPPWGELHLAYLEVGWWRLDEQEERRGEMREEMRRGEMMKDATWSLSLV